MSFRSRLVISFLLVSALPIVGLALFFRSEMTLRLSEQYRIQVDAVISGFGNEIRAIDQELADRLQTLQQSVADDNQFRLSIDNPVGDRSYLLDYAGRAMRIGGLDALQFQDTEGRILSSGQFRNEFDRLDARIVPLIEQYSAPEATPPLVAMRTPEGPIYVLARVGYVRIGNRTLSIVAGADLFRRLASLTEGNPSLMASVEVPGGTTFRSPFVAGPAVGSAPPPETVPASQASQFAAIERELRLPFIGDDSDSVPTQEGRSARVVIEHDRAGLEQLRRRIDTFILLTVLATGLIAALLIYWNAVRMSRPLAELARKSDRLDLGRLDVDFTVDRNDEIGQLSGVLDRMTRRLKAGAVSLKEAERRAAVGDLARQVNHDVKNGLTPIRNIVRHLTELAANQPDALPETYRDRSPALEASISYLETLSSNYGRLTIPLKKAPCQMESMLRQVAEDYGIGNAVNIRVQADVCPPVLADPVALRRIVENLVSNALDSLVDGSGDITLSAGKYTDDTKMDWIRLVVSDTGLGMDPEQKSRIFENFYTSKETGTGLGLPIVRRLVMDQGGSISVDSEPGHGTQVTVLLPPAPQQRQS